ncbi:MAG: hypothetical protein ACI8QZ_003452 [Chlamydiales bacterium]|jgi:hypothetical protein
MVDETPGPEIEEQLPPYVIEGARSGRSGCKTCRRKIEKESLRLGILIEGPFGTGYMWHHLKCSARRHFEKLEEAYELEAWKEAKVEPKDLPALEELKKLHEVAEVKKKEKRTLPYAELAPSGRSKCKQCSEVIEKDAARIVLGREVEFGRQVRTTPINLHPRCVPMEMQAPDCAHEPDGFLDELRANSPDLASRMEDLATEIGALG